MGIVTFDISNQKTIFINNLLNPDVFVKGSTYLGGAAKEKSGILGKYAE